jgi:hypothetical protein
MWELFVDGAADYTLYGPTRTLTIGKAIGNFVAVPPAT